MMRNSEAKNIPDSLGNYYASNRATAIINYNKYFTRPRNWKSVCGIQR